MNKYSPYSNCTTPEENKVFLKEWGSQKYLKCYQGVFFHDGFLAILGKVITTELLV